MGGTSGRSAAAGFAQSTATGVKSTSLSWTGTGHEANVALLVFSASEGGAGVALEGDTEAASDADGTLNLAITMAGDGEAASDADGTLIRTMELGGDSEAAADFDGTLIRTIEPAGVSEAAADFDGTLSLGIALGGDGEAAADLDGTLNRIRDISGDAEGAADADGTISLTVELAGDADAASDAEGTIELTGEVILSGQAEAASDADGALSLTLSLSGDATAAGDADGTLDLAGTVSLAGTAPASGSASGDLSLTEQFGGTATAAGDADGTLTVTGQVRRDTMVLPIAESLLACLCEAVAEAPNPPASCCLRPGVTVAQGVSEHEDECCEGLAWVRVVRVFPTGSDVGFPAINDDPHACSPPSYGIELEMGIYRCAPTGDAMNLPTCAEWTATAEQILDDAASLRRAWCCFRDNYDNSAKLVGQWAPVTVQGGCTGGTLTIMIESYCSDCEAGS
jgi:hypothetical protein